MSAHRKKHCESKKVFLTRTDALEACVFVFARTKQILYPYNCAYCRQWHTGHPARDAEGKVNQPGDWLEKYEETVKEVKIKLKNEAKSRRLLKHFEETLLTQQEAMARKEEKAERHATEVREAQERKMERDRLNAIRLAQKPERQPYLLTVWEDDGGSYR